MKLIESKRKEGYDYSFLFLGLRDSPMECKAGTKYFLLDSNGDSWSSLSSRLSGDDKSGTRFSARGSLMRSRSNLSFSI